LQCGVVDSGESHFTPNQVKSLAYEDRVQEFATVLYSDWGRSDVYGSEGKETFTGVG
jgi:hypothetical protein